MGRKFAATRRVWLRIESTRWKLAVCGLYLRTEGPKSGEHFKNNEKILEKLRMEQALLEEQGYRVGYYGEFNAHVSIDERFRLPTNPISINNNGRLVIEFASEMDLHCLNPLKSQGTRED